MVSREKIKLIASPGKGCRIWFVLMVITSMALLVGACGRGGQKAVIAEVNGQRITVKDFHAELARAPEDMRVVYEQEPEEVLDRLISATLVLQEAKRRGLVNSSDLKDLEKPDVKDGMQRLMEQAAKEAEVTDKEVEAFYRQCRDQLGGKPLADVREDIRVMILEQKGQQTISAFVEKLRAQAAIKTFPEQLPKPLPPALEASTAEAFQAALKSGRPTVVDFGSKRCVPCLQLRPVLREVKDAHKDRINVLMMEVSDHRDLTRHYKITLVPTLIFFDVQGREVQRKTGFMNRSELEGVLSDLKFLGG